MNATEPPPRWNQPILVVLLIAILTAGLVVLGTQGLVGIGHLVQAQLASDHTAR